MVVNAVVWGIRLVCLACLLLLAFTFGDYLRDPTVFGGLLLFLAFVVVMVLIFFLVGPGGIAELGLFRSSRAPGEAPIETPEDSRPLAPAPRQSRRSKRQRRQRPAAPATPVAGLPEGNPEDVRVVERRPPRSRGGLWNRRRAPERPPSRPTPSAPADEPAWKRAERELAEQRTSRPAAPEEPAPAPAAAASGAIDLNTATQADLVALRGIGPVAARRILAERDANGPFADLDDLRRVDGFGPSRIAQLAEQGVTAH